MGTEKGDSTQYSVWGRAFCEWETFLKEVGTESS